MRLVAFSLFMRRLAPDLGRHAMFTTGRQIKAARILAGLEQTQLARAAGLHRNAVSYWETHAVITGPEPSALHAIRKVLAGAGVCVSRTSAGLQLIAAAEINPTAPNAMRDAQFAELTR